MVKAIQLLPGVKSSGDGGAGFYVRGGSTDQSLILLDEGLVYNASHLLGFFSTFNTNAIKDVQISQRLHARAVRRQARIGAGHPHEGWERPEAGVSGSIGTISTNLTVEGPIKKDKASFIIAARRTYADVFLKLPPIQHQQQALLLRPQWQGERGCRREGQALLERLPGQRHLGPWGQPGR
ncbi:MAG: Plug domain-containing protein [Flavobacteriales bacterium]|nr:Plug domain-containing protein [Flavobacteriales bacterium]